MDQGLPAKNNPRGSAQLPEAVELWRAFQATATSSNAAITESLLKDLTRCTRQANEAAQRGDHAAAVRARREQVAVATRAVPQNDPLVVQAEIQLGRALLKNKETELGLESLAESLQRAKNLPHDGHELLHRVAMAAHREVLDVHLHKGDFRTLLAALSDASSYTAQHTHPTSAETIELAFERVLALEALRAASDEPNAIHRAQINQAIVDTRTLLLAEECGATTHRRAELLHTLGLKLFSACAWDEAAETLLRSLSLVSDPLQRSSSLLMLAQIAAYQSRNEEAKQYLDLLDSRIVSQDPGNKLLLDQVRLFVFPNLDSNVPTGALATDPPILRCIKDHLVRGYVLLTNHQILAAQGTLEGAGALISHQYHSDHVLWSTNHLLLCKVFTERANEIQERSSFNEHDWRGLLDTARSHAMSSYRIQQSLEGAPEAKRQALTFALSLSEALGDTAQELEIRALLRDL